MKLRNKKIVFLFLIQALVVSAVISIIKNDGYYKRFNIIGLNTELINFIDNSKYEKKRTDFIKNLKNVKNINYGNIKVLIIGNSFADDIYNSFILNKNLYKDFEFNLINKQIYDFDNSQNEIEGFYENYDFIIIASKYSMRDLKSLSFFSKPFTNKAKLIVLNQRPMFSQRNKFGGKFSFIDDFIFKNKRFPDDLESFHLEKMYYKNYQENHFNVSGFNEKLNEMKLNLNFQIYDLFSYICDNYSMTCKYRFNKNIKIYHDYGHFTLDASKYLGKKFFKDGLISK